MSSGVQRMKVALLLVAIAATIAFPLSASAGARAKDPRPKRLSLDDAPYYLDIIHTLPPSFRPLNPEDFGADVPEDSATTVYGSDESGALVILHLAVGQGRTSRVVMEALFEHPEDFFASEDLSGYLADNGIPAEQVSVTPGPWNDAAVGDRAVTAVHGLEVEGERGYFEMLVMLVGRGKDTALVEIDHLFTAVPTVDVADVAGAIAAKIRSGPPSRDQKIATAGLITLADLPSGWESAPNPSPTTGGSAAAGSDVGTPNAEATAIALGIPACGTFVKLGGAASNATTQGTSSQKGLRFRQGRSTANSNVWTYPTRVGANGFFELVRDPSVRACLDKLYLKVATVAVRASGDSLPAAQREELDRVRVTVTTPQSQSVGDEHVLYRVAVDLNPVREVRFVVEQEFVRAGRAVGVYTFAGLEDATVRDQVLPTVVDRLAAAQ